MAFPITPFIDLLNSIICAFCSYQLYKSFRRESTNRVLLYFSQGYFSLIFSYLFFSLPRLISPENSHLLGITFVIAQAFLYIALAFFVRVTTSIVKPDWSKIAFGIILLISLISVIVSVIFINYPNYDITTGITEWEIQPIVSTFSTLIFLLTLIPSAFFFLWQGFKSQDKLVRTRSLIIGSGLLILIITAYTYYNATTETAAFISDVFSLASFLVIFIGIIYKRNQAQSSIANNS
jgi:hypothetical protein